MKAVRYQITGDERTEVFLESSLEAAVSPECQQVSTQIHDTAELQTIRDLPMWERQCWLRYAPRRFACATCRKTFVERVAWREPGFAHTLRTRCATHSTFTNALGVRTWPRLRKTKV